MRSLFVSILLLLSTLTCFAASSKWNVVDGARIRLIGMDSPDSRSYRAGLQIELQPGWKTYWRNPGGSGLPPQLNFTTSTNVRSTELKFPVPRYFEEDGSIGYKKSVTFPITVEPSIAGLPMKVNVIGLVGICSDICIPTQIDISMNTGTSQATNFQIARALNDADALIPRSSQHDLMVENVHLSGDSEKSAVVSVRIPKEAADLALFVEGPPALYLTRGKLITRGKTSAKFKVELKDAQDLEALVGTNLRFTLRADTRSIEQTLPVEAATQ